MKGDQLFYDALVSFAERRVIYMNEKIKSNIIKVIPILMIVVCTCIVILSSPRDYLSQFPSGDSTYFMYIGKALKEGRIMYNGAWDSKGPFLFFINYLAMIINETWGVVIMRTIFLFAFFISLYKLLKYISDKLWQIFLVMFVLSLMIVSFIGEGNLSEEYSLPLITISLFYFVQYIMRGSIEYYKIFICGVLCGLCFLLRANMIITWCVFSGGIFLYMCYKKEIIKLFQYIISFILGLVVAFLPFIIYFLIHGNLREAWYASVVFNILYCDTSDNTLLSMLKWVYQNLNLSCFVFILCFFFFGTIIFILTKHNNDRQRFFGFIYLLYILLAIWSACMSYRQYTHYLLGLIPAMAIPSIIVIIKGEEYLSKYFVPQKISVCFFIIMTLIFNLQTLDILKTKFDAYSTVPEKQNVYQEVGEYIKRNTTSDNTIYCHRMWGTIYLTSDRLAATKYFALSAVDVDNFPKMSKGLFNDLKQNEPVYIVTKEDRTSGKNTDNNLKKYIKKYYILEKTFDQNIHLYKLK